METSNVEYKKFKQKGKGRNWFVNLMKQSNYMGNKEKGTKRCGDGG